MEAVGQYGRALFEIAKEEGWLGGAEVEVRHIREAIGENPEIIRLPALPSLSETEKLAALETLFPGRISPEMMGFLAAVVKNGKWEALDAILGSFENCVREHEQIAEVSVTTAVALTEAQQERIRNRLLALTRYRKLAIVYSADASLIGGIIVQIGDRRADASVRTRLEALTGSLMNGQAGT